MALFTAINFLAMRLFNKVNSAITWWKVAVPVAAIIILLFKFHGGNFNSHGGFLPFGTKAMFAAIPASGIVFAYLGFEQADQLAGEVKNPAAEPAAGDHHRDPHVHGDLHPAAGRVHRRAAAERAGHGWAALKTNTGLIGGPLAFIAGAAALGWFAVILRIDAFVSPSGTGLVYQTSTSRVGYGLARNRYYPQIFAKVDKNGVPWVSLILAFVLGLVFLLPFPSWSALVSLVTGRAC